MRVIASCLLVFCLVTAVGANQDAIRAVANMDQEAQYFFIPILIQELADADAQTARLIGTTLYQIGPQGVDALLDQVAKTGGDEAYPAALALEAITGDLDWDLIEEHWIKLGTTQPHPLVRTLAYEVLRANGAFDKSKTRDPINWTWPEGIDLILWLGALAILGYALRHIIVSRFPQFNQGWGRNIQELGWMVLLAILIWHSLHNSVPSKLILALAVFFGAFSKQNTRPWVRPTKTAAIWALALTLVVIGIWGWSRAQVVPTFHFTVDEIRVDALDDPQIYGLPPQKYWQVTVQLNLTAFRLPPDHDEFVLLFSDRTSLSSRWRSPYTLILKRDQIQTGLKHEFIYVFYQESLSPEQAVTQVAKSLGTVFSSHQGNPEFQRLPMGFWDPPHLLNRCEIGGRDTGQCDWIHGECRRILPRGRVGMTDHRGRLSVKAYTPQQMLEMRGLHAKGSDEVKNTRQKPKTGWFTQGIQAPREGRLPSQVQRHQTTRPSPFASEEQSG